MNKIEITTPHNAIIDYELAKLEDRILAFFLDAIFSSITMSLLSLIISPLTGGMESPITWTVSIISITFYHLLFETLNKGQSPGKMIAQIRVVKINGSSPSLFNYLMRWAFRLLDISFSMGILSALSISSSSRNQRLGDILADTTVIRLSRKSHFPLSALLRGYESQKDPISIPEARLLTEQEALLIKETLVRHSKYPNSGSQMALLELVNQTENILGITSGKQNGVHFLNQVLKDYVIQTR